MTIMLCHGMDMVFHAHYDMIMALSWHVYHGCHKNDHDRSMVIMKNTMIMLQLPWSLLLRVPDVNYRANSVY